MLILADDLGYGDAGCYGATKITTPHIDRLAQEGMRFTDAHSPHSVCTPTRYSLMLLFGSNMSNGDSHDGRNLPLVLAGRGGGTLRPNRFIDYGDRPEEEQRACNLYLALAQQMGVPLDHFGDSAQPLPELG